MLRYVPAAVSSDNSLTNINSQLTTLAHSGITIVCRLCLTVQDQNSKFVGLSSLEFYEDLV